MDGKLSEGCHMLEIFNALIKLLLMLCYTIFLINLIIVKIFFKKTEKLL